jgi:hypothetical protein
MRTAAVSWLAGLASGLASSVSCTPPPQMCMAEPECGTQSSCVAGRCVAHGAIPLIASARRVVFAPADAATVHRGGGGPGPSARIVSLGRDDDALVLLRFEVPLPAEAKVIEAYLVLQRAVGVHADPTLIALHAARIVGPWDGRTVSWAGQPPLEDFGAPVTRVRSASGPVVRLDVHDLVQRWRRHGRDEFGVAVVAEGRSPTGIAFAMAPTPGDRGSPSFIGPVLELYVK